MRRASPPRLLGMIGCTVSTGMYRTGDNDIHTVRGMTKKSVSVAHAVTSDPPGARQSFTYAGTKSDRYGSDSAS
jgi:hypothetical protein